ncbi:MAG: ComF family protein [Acidiferrobacterales bacterium]|jgi:ComF family protein
MTTMLHESVKSIQQWLFPGNCLLCAAHVLTDTDFCADCDAALPRLTATCPRCAAPMVEGGMSVQPCGQCQQRTPAFARTLAMFQYAPPIDRLLQGLKYYRRLELARFLGRRLAAFVEGHAVANVDRIVPVPLHSTRLRERGYNQSLEIARPLARRLGIPLDYESVRRERATEPQTGLPHKARQRNVRGAFSASDALAGLRVALVDDVMTTGHTVNTLARCVRQAGAKAVEIWVVARA